MLRKSSFLYCCIFVLRGQRNDYVFGCKHDCIDMLAHLWYNNPKKGGGIMKKFFSLFFFMLVIAVFLFELYFSIAGAIDVNNRFAELAARGASGHELLGVGLDILVFGIVLFSILGFVFAIISWKVAQHRAVRIISGVMCPLFLLPIFISALILTL